MTTFTSHSRIEDRIEVIMAALQVAIACKKPGALKLLDFKPHPSMAHLEPVIAKLKADLLFHLRQACSSRIPDSLSEALMLWAEEAEKAAMALAKEVSISPVKSLISIRLSDLEEVVCRPVSFGVISTIGAESFVIGEGYTALRLFMLSKQTLLRANPKADGYYQLVARLKPQYFMDGYIHDVLAHDVDCYIKGERKFWFDPDRCSSSVQDKTKSSWVPVDFNQPSSINQAIKRFS